MMAWSVQFFPNEVDAISMEINNEGWDADGDGTAWRASEGLTEKSLPEKWRYLDNIHVYAAAIPRGKNASLQVRWDGNNRQKMDFDNDESHDVSKS
jgi:hypothetical protein